MSVYHDLYRTCHILHYSAYCPLATILALDMSVQINNIKFIVIHASSHDSSSTILYM